MCQSISNPFKGLLSTNNFRTKNIRKSTEYLQQKYESISELKNINIRKDKNVEYISDKIYQLLGISFLDEYVFKNNIKHMCFYKIILINKLNLSSDEKNHIEKLYNKCFDQILPFIYNIGHFDEYELKERLDDECELKERLNDLTNTICNFKSHTPMFENTYGLINNIIIPLSTFIFDSAFGAKYDELTEGYFCTSFPDDSTMHCETTGVNLMVSIIFSVIVGSFTTGSVLALLELISKKYANSKDELIHNYIKQFIPSFEIPAKEHFNNLQHERISFKEVTLVTGLIYAYSITTDALPVILPNLFPNTPKNFTDDFALNLAVGGSILICANIVCKIGIGIYNGIYSYCFQKRDKKTLDTYTLISSPLGHQNGSNSPLFALTV